MEPKELLWRACARRCGGVGGLLPQRRDANKVMGRIGMAGLTIMSTGLGMLLLDACQQSSIWWLISPTIAAAVMMMAALADSSLPCSQPSVPCIGSAPCGGSTSRDIHGIATPTDLDIEEHCTSSCVRSPSTIYNSLKVASVVLGATLRAEHPISALSPVRSPRSPATGARRSLAYREAKLPGAARYFEGTWSVEQTTNLDEYLRHVGLGWALRQIAAAFLPEPTYSIRDGVLHGTTPGPMGAAPMHDTFRTGSETLIRMLGHDVNVRYTWEGDVLIARAQSDGLAFGQPIEIRRWVDAPTDRLCMMSKTGGITSMRYYRRKV